MAYLGLDLGTSGLRGLLMSRNGSVFGAAEAGYDVSRPATGWSEQAPSDWIAALQTVVEQLRSSHADFAKVRGIGVSGHMHGATLLDDQGDVLRPCILWNDTRSQHEAEELNAMPEFRALSGNIVFPGFTAPKLMWVARQEPDLFMKTARVLLPAAYLNYWLTGDFVGDFSDASGTSWLDVGERRWSKALLTQSGMRIEQMPNLVEGNASAGRLRSDLVADWGLNENVVVAGGAGDNAAAACGIGALEEGDAFVSLGTSGVILAARDRYAPMPDTAVHTFCHAVPGRWYQMGVILSATDCLNWLARQIGHSPSELTSALGPEIGPPGAVQFLPYLSGERTPHNDADIRAAFLGLDIGHEPIDLTRAVLEGVSFALKDSLDALASTGTKIERLIAVGGGSASDYWLRLLASVLDVRIDVPSQGEFGAALGAARLALCAAEDAAPADVMSKPDIAQSVHPDPQLVADYSAAWARWRRIYPAVKTLT